MFYCFFLYTVQAQAQFDFESDSIGYKSVLPPPKPQLFTFRYINSALGQVAFLEMSVDPADTVSRWTCKAGIVTDYKSVEVKSVEVEPAYTLDSLWQSLNDLGIRDLPSQENATVIFLHDKRKVPVSPEFLEKTFSHCWGEFQQIELHYQEQHRIATYDHSLLVVNHFTNIPQQWILEDHEKMIAVKELLHPFVDLDFFLHLALLKLQRIQGR